MAAAEGTLVGIRARSDAFVVALAVVSLVWIGVLLGVSFLATPVKFLAPTLTLPVALDVGRQTFHWLNRVELVLAVATLVSAIGHEWPVLRRASRPGGGGDAGGAGERAGVPAAHPYGTLLGGFLLAAVALQALWLLPLLDARVEVIIQGGMPPPSFLHDAYVVVEATKLGALVGAAWLAIAALCGGSARSAA